MTALVAKLKALPAGADAEAIQNEVFMEWVVPRASGNCSGPGSRRSMRCCWPEPGPCFESSFTAIFGIDRTVALIERALAGDLVGA